ncbi:MAG: hypothetical protein NTX64_14470 [Elusimicrobia bacterium]|nr:hypothetical protein [Elusimicrobiota bacterium]
MSTRKPSTPRRRAVAGQAADEVGRVLGQELRVERGVVDDEIGDDAHAGVVGARDEGLELVERAEVRIDGLEVGDRVRRASRRAGLAAFSNGEDAHHPQRVEAHALDRGDVAVLEIGEEALGLLDALRGALAVEVVGAREDLVDARLPRPGGLVGRGHGGAQLLSVLGHEGHELAVFLDRRAGSGQDLLDLPASGVGPGDRGKQRVEVAAVVVELARQRAVALARRELALLVHEAFQAGGRRARRPGIRGAEHEGVDVGVALAGPIRQERLRLAQRLLVADGRDQGGVGGAVRHL